LEIGDMRPSLYLDLESNSDRAKLADPEAYLASHEDELDASSTPFRFSGVSNRSRSTPRAALDAAAEEVR
jgi:hypothetical protein